MCGHDTGRFWTVIEGSSAVAKGQRKRAEWLTGQLALLPVPEIVEFGLHLAMRRKRVDTHLMWGAAWNIEQGWCSSDGFYYFQPWLVGLGRDVFEQVASDPDSLADVPQVRRLAGRPRSSWADDEWPDWELLNHVARKACQRITGEEDRLFKALESRGLHFACYPTPGDDPWDYNDPGQLRARLPRLTALLG
jgi:hypothetical protein